MSIRLFLICVATIGASFAQDFASECPEKNGFFADAVQCDRYYECKDGQVIDQLCPDGLVFDETSYAYAKCSFPFSVDCTDRPELQKAKPTELCPRRNGYFTHEDPKECGKFYFCVDGAANPISCPESLIFNPATGQCAYSDQVNREGCTAKDFFKFTCPDDKETKFAHPRFPDPEDCQYFFVCIDGTEPRRTACSPGLVYNPDTASCDSQSNLKDPFCSQWYNETYLESLKLNTPSHTPNPGGVPLSAEQQQNRVVVRRRKPVPQAQLASDEVALEQTVRDPNLSRIRESKIPLSQVSSASFATSNRQQQKQQQQQKVRTRVRLPSPLPSQEEGFEQEEEAGGPPKFALSSEDDIQKFRETNQFSPQTNQGSRLTFLSVPTQTRPRPQLPVEDVEEEAPEPQNKFQSRRPAFVPQRPQPERDFSQESQFQNSPPQNGRQRLQITQIPVRPQAVGVEENPEEFENFHRIPQPRQRNQG